MIKAHEEYARQAAAAGRQGDLLPGAVLRAVLLPGAGPAVLRVRRVDPRARRSSGSRRWPPSSAWCMVLPMYEQEQPGVLYNTAAVVDADGTYLGKYRKNHIPQVKGFWEKFYFRPGNLGYPGVRHRGRQGRRLHLLRPALPGGLAGARPGRRPDRVQPVARPAAACRPTCGSSSSRPSAVANEYFIGAINRVGIEATSATTTSTARRTSSTRRASSSASVADAHEPELIVRDLDLDLLAEVRDRWAFYRDRRPDAYDGHRPVVKP